MKKLLSLFCGVFLIMTAQAQTLFTYGKNAVDVDEFLRAYNKNNMPVADKEQAIKDYLDLYIKFKLKVQAAHDLRLDTTEQIRNDLQNFRQQVEDNYMTDEKGREAMLAQAIERSLVEKHILHFAIPFTPDSSKDARAAADLYQSLEPGDTSYSAIINNVRFAQTPIRFNDVGFLSVFALPYNFENIVYKLKPGEVSKPYRTKTAWHLFKLKTQRPASGKWKVAQILFSVPADASEEEKMRIKLRADSIYNELIKGADFAKMANQHSEDRLTNLNGGELAEFTTGKYHQVFEKEVMQLKHNGDLTKPFATPFGYHIVKRLGHIPAILDKSDAALQYDIKQVLLKDARLEMSKQKFTSDIAKMLGYKRLGGVSESDLMRFADSVMLLPTQKNISRFPISSKPVIGFNSGMIKGSDWLNFVVEYKRNYDNYKGETNQELWDKFTAYAINNFYKKDMEKYNPDFKYQMKEFREGNMLFEIMERNVWGRSALDTPGLKNYYEANKTKYVWPISADVLIFNTSSEQAAKAAMASLEKGMSSSRLIAESKGTIQLDSGRYELTQIMGSDYNDIPEAGSFTNIIKTMDSAALFVKFLTIYPAGQLKSFDASRGLVINDYQTVLEEEWIDALKKKYPVKVNEKVWESVLKSAVKP